ncbi:hypothetical protein R3P38DRAFT_3348325 [Favolaschia claudopus]|uniref:Uncharacterized protein n=1 Tax=Favolaschia claudopus TaxID=2862362 RepID=A0AAW0CU66_9AGAR
MSNNDADNWQFLRFALQAAASKSRPNFGEHLKMLNFRALVENASAQRLIQYRTRGELALKLFLCDYLASLDAGFSYHAAVNLTVPHFKTLQYILLTHWPTVHEKDSPDLLFLFLGIFDIHGQSAVATWMSDVFAPIVDAVVAGVNKHLQIRLLKANFNYLQGGGTGIYFELETDTWAQRRGVIEQFAFVSSVAGLFCQEPFTPASGITQAPSTPSLDADAIPVPDQAGSHSLPQTSNEIFQEAHTIGLEPLNPAELDTPDPLDMLISEPPHIAIPDPAETDNPEKIESAMNIAQEHELDTLEPSGLDVADEKEIETDLQPTTLPSPKAHNKRQSLSRRLFKTAHKVVSAVATRTRWTFGAAFFNGDILSYVEDTLSLATQASINDAQNLQRTPPRRRSLLPTTNTPGAGDYRLHRSMTESTKADARKARIYKSRA